MNRSAVVESDQTHCEVVSPTGIYSEVLAENLLISVGFEQIKNRIRFLGIADKRQSVRRHWALETPWCLVFWFLGTGLLAQWPLVVEPIESSQCWETTMTPPTSHSLWVSVKGPWGTYSTQSASWVANDHEPIAGPWPGQGFCPCLAYDLSIILGWQIYTNLPYIYTHIDTCSIGKDLWTLFYLNDDNLHRNVTQKTRGYQPESKESSPKPEWACQHDGRMKNPISTIKRMYKHEH